MISSIVSSLMNGTCRLRLNVRSLTSINTLHVVSRATVRNSCSNCTYNQNTFTTQLRQNQVVLQRFSCRRNFCSSSQNTTIDKVDNNDEGSHHLDQGTAVLSNTNMIVPRTTRRSSFSTNGQGRHHRNTNATMMNQFILQQFKPEAIVPVRAIHAAQTIDLNILASSIFQQNAIKKQMFGKNSIVIQLADNITIPTTTTGTTKSASATVNKSDTSNATTSPTTTATTNNTHYNRTTTTEHNLSESSSSTVMSPRYMAVFRFGSIVYFNVDEDIAKKLTCYIKKVAAFGPVPAGLERKEHFGVVVTRDLDISSNNAMISSLLLNDQHGHVGDTTSGTANGNEALMFEPVTGDYCMVPELDMNGVAVIGTIMGQTVTLDSYSDTVEELLTNFARINSTVTQTGSFTSGDKSFLFKTVAQNNSIFIDMISKVRIKDRSDTAWNLTKYETIHYGLKEEFELDDRFENIEFKLNLIHNNAKFFLEVMHHQKANNLEWIIVVLILAECILMCIEMSGFGESFFRGIFGFIPFYPPAADVEIVATSATHKLDVIDRELHLNDENVHK